MVVSPEIIFNHFYPYIVSDLMVDTIMFYTLLQLWKTETVHFTLKRSKGTAVKNVGYVFSHHQVLFVLICNFSLFPNTTCNKIGS